MKFGLAKTGISPYLNLGRLDWRKVSFMAKIPAGPPLEGLRRQIARHRSGKPQRSDGLFVRETFRLDRVHARQKAQEWFDTWPKAAYWTEVESWRQLEGDEIEFTMRRLPSAD
jgi:hypothetical protein